MDDRKLYTAAEVGEIYGIARVTVTAIARQRGLSRRGRDWIFTAAEVKLLKPRPPGRPRKKDEGEK
jgi:hypothetical protein